MTGGKIWVESETGMRSCFHLTIQTPVVNAATVFAPPPASIASLKNLAGSIFIRMEELEREIQRLVHLDITPAGPAVTIA